MFKIFKKLTKGSSINYELINDWSKLCHESGLSQGQVLGIAYHSAMISTVIASTSENSKILKPLESVVSDIGLVSSEGANVLYIYREYYWLASNWDEHIEPFPFQGLPDDFFNHENPYSQYFQGEYGYFLKSRCSTLLLQRIGKILEDYKITLERSFTIGHGHANFLLSSSVSMSTAESVIMANIFPYYSAEIIDYLPKNSFKSPINNLWLLSKIFHRVISSEFNTDQQFQEWLWYFHNAIFYENKLGSQKIRSEWSIDDPNFEMKMLESIMSNTNSFYLQRSNLGLFKPIQNINFDKWEEFFPLLNNHLKDKYEVRSPNSQFINTGEVCNYYAFKFIASVELILSNKK